MEHRIALSVIVPTYRSTPHFSLFFQRLVDELCLLRLPCEIIVVDDGSGDGTPQLLRDLLKNSLPVGWKNGVSRGIQDNILRVRIVFLRENSGQQQATLCGIRHASGKVMVTLDDDLQHPPDQIASLLRKLFEGYDLVYGVPQGRTASALRRFGSFLRDALFLLLFGGRAYGIRPTSFRAFRRELADTLFGTAAPVDGTAGGQNVAELPRTRDKGVSPSEAPVESFLYLSAEFFRLTHRISCISVRARQTDTHHSRYPLARLVRSFAGLALYLPVFPRGLRRHYGGIRWVVEGVEEGELECG